MSANDQAKDQHEDQVNLTKNKDSDQATLIKVSTESSASSTSTSTPPRQRIRILSYNLYVRPPGIKTNESDFKSDRLDDFAALHLGSSNGQGYDIVAFQELFGFMSSRKQALIDRAKLLGFNYSADIPVPWNMWMRLKPVDSGVLLLSKFPIVHSESIIYDRGTHADAFACKGALYVYLKVRNFHSSSASTNSSFDPSDHIHLVCTHLQASYDGSSAKNQQAQQQVRITQVAQLRALMLKHRKRVPQSPMILLGDLNVNGRKSVDNGVDHSEEYLEMLRQLQMERDPNSSSSSASSDSVKFVDLIWESLGEHPITVGDAKRDAKGEFLKPLVPLETALTNPKDLLCRKSLDYIFYLPPFVPSSLSSSSNASPQIIPNVSMSNPIVKNDSPATPSLPNFENSNFATPIVSQSKVEQFFIENKKYTQLSDHYGVSATLHIPLNLDNAKNK